VQVSSTTGSQAAIDVADRVRLDHVYRCAVPFRMTAPASARMVKCETTTFVDGRPPAGTIWFRVGTATPEYQVSSYADQPAVAPNDTVAGRAVRLSRHRPGSADPAELEIIYPPGRPPRSPEHYRCASKYSFIAG
jgi:hypothetical protein